MKVNKNKIEGIVIRDNDTYIVEDNRFLKNMVLSKTTLHPGKDTAGHSHPGLEEVYFFKSGKGVMQLNDEFFDVEEGDIVLIPDGAFHRVYNSKDPEGWSKNTLEFVCVFQSYEREN
jgi:mannose-6-phosphate isomerase-like protein (cupin superfamily)